MRYVYTVFLYVLLPFILLRLLWKGRKNSAYRARIKERLLWGRSTASPVDVWVHAVSLGEVVAAKMLIEELLAANQRVLVTTMTPTGSEQVTRLFGTRVMHQYVPYDFPLSLRRFFKKYQPRVGMIMETELWPNLMVEAKKRGSALFIANARISDKAFPAYQRVRWFFKPLWACVTGVFAQSAQDGERFCALGAPKDKVHVLGNMKSDLKISHDVSKPVRFLKEAWGDKRPVVIAASTHEGEEEQVLSVLAELQAALPNVVLLIAPRHPERFEVVYKLARTHQFKTGRRSQAGTVESDTEVVVLDSLGELLGFYDLSDYAFVGGSLVSIGGHNVLEPIALEVPVFCGMFMQNSKNLCEELMRADAMQQVPDAKGLVLAIRALYHNPNLREAQIKRATEALKISQGAVARHVDAIASYLD
jgi:3-deoxy-D-manno-octulosonic-acid transferase